MADLLALGAELPLRMLADGRSALPCPVHGVLIPLSVAGGRIHAECPQGCASEDVLAVYAEQSPMLREWLNDGEVPREGPSLNSGATGGRAKNTDAPATEEQDGTGASACSEDDKPQNTATGASGQRLDRNPPIPLKGTALEPVFQRVPPQNIEAEQALLGAIFLDNTLIGEISRVIVPSDFYRESHREIYKAMLRMRDAQNEIDAVTIAYELAQAKVIDAVGGGGYLAELAAAPPWVQNFARYAEIVKECAIKRDIIRGAHELMLESYNGSTLVDLREQAQHLVPAVAGGLSLPVLITPEIEIISGRELWRRHSNAIARQWIVEGWLPRKEISLWSGKVEAGKTTSMRTLVMCVARGEAFLERQVNAARVLYVMLDADGEDLTVDEFRRLGWSPNEDPIDFLIDPVMCLRSNSFEQFHRRLLDLGPGLVIIDPLGRFQKIEEKDGGFSGYGMTYAMARFSELAKRAECHIALLHHIPRGRNDKDDPATAGYGSVAIAGGCNARFTFYSKPGRIYTIRTSRGKGGGFVPLEGEQVLQRDDETHWVSLRGVFDWKDQARSMMDQVLAVIESSEEQWTAAALGRAAGVSRSVAGMAAKMLNDEGKIYMKEEGKGHKYVFWRKSIEPQQGNLGN